MERTNRPTFFKQVGESVVPISWVEAQPLIADYRNRAIACDVCSTQHRVSTSFLVFDHAFFGPEPVLYNTIVTSPNGAERIAGRYASRADAIRGHAEILALISLVEGKKQSGSGEWT